MNITFVVHYFPPQNNSGIRRVLALCKYFHELGHNITVITTPKSGMEGYGVAEPIPNYINYYECGKKTNTHNQIKTATSSHKKVGQYLKAIKHGLMHVFGQLIDHRIFFATYFYRKSLPENLSQAIKSSDVIISSAPPWPVHWAAKIISKKYKKVWIADYRDQFSGWHKFKSNPITRWLEKKIDSNLMASANAVVTISPPMQSYYSLMNKSVECVENGYDAEMFLQIQKQIPNRDEVANRPIIVRFLGSIIPNTLPKALLVALDRLGKEGDERFCFEFYGDTLLLTAYLKEYHLSLLDSPLLKIHSRVTYQQALELMCAADMLFMKETSDQGNASAKGMMTNKMFEYMAAKKPVIAEIADNTIMAEALSKSGLKALTYLDEKNIYDYLKSFVNNDLQKQEIDNSYIEQFSRKKQARVYESIIKKAIAQVDKS